MNDCGICLQKLTLPHTLECGHQFCYVCIKFNTISNGFTCPLCRGKFNKDELDTVTIDDIVDNDDASIGNIKWYYAGRGGGHWQYDEISQLLLEENYQQWKEDHSSNGEAGYFPQYGTTDEELLEHGLIPILIGDINKFYFNFEEMYQYNHRNGAKRNITRADNSDEEQDVDICLKGIAGIKINQKKYTDFAKKK